MSEPEVLELPPHEPTLLDRLCEMFALAGGAVLTALALMSVWSIVGRWLFSKPLQGDYELVQMGCAIFVALCLPYCQLKYANIIIDFFTTRATVRTQARLDAIGALVLGLVMLLVAWRTGVGLLSIRESGETTTILGLPTWWTYAGMFPGIALTAIVAFRCALDRVRVSLR
jgi:TRAP-type C4-dicarboxylate transport system permease small subunit